MNVYDSIYCLNFYFWHYIVVVSIERADCAPFDFLHFRISEIFTKNIIKL